MSAEHTKTARILKLLILLQQSRSYAISELTERLNVSARTVFRDLRELQDLGFAVAQTSNRYRIRQADRHSIPPGLAAHNTGTTDVESHPTERGKALHLIAQLSAAIENRKAIRLFDYESLKGRSFPRTLEPFRLSSNEQSLWAYDTGQRACRQFKLLRMGEIQVLDQDWENSHKHRLPFTDLFNMSAPEPIDTIRIRLSAMADKLLAEELPDSRQYEDRRSKRTFTIPVASYRGAGRFVLGLMDGIEVLGSEAFKEYLRHVIRQHGRFR